MAERQLNVDCVLVQQNSEKKKIFFKIKGTLTQQIFRVTIIFNQNFPIMQPCALHKIVVIGVARDNLEASEDAGVPSAAPERRTAGD